MDEMTDFPKSHKYQRVLSPRTVVKSQFRLRIKNYLDMTNKSVILTNTNNWGIKPN